jgi:large subunit ribosomal protein LP2
MRHIAAYLLLQIGGNATPSAADVKKVLSAVGIEADDERLDKLISELEGKNIDQVRHTLSRHLFSCANSAQLIAEGTSKLASVRVVSSLLSLQALPAHACSTGFFWRRRCGSCSRCGWCSSCCCCGREEGGEEGGREGTFFFGLVQARNAHLAVQEESDDDMGFGLFD